MHPCVYIIFSLFLLCHETTTSKQLVTVGEGGDDTNGVMNKCLDKESDALLHFKAHLQDPDGRLSTWRADKHDCCKWSGVTCNNQTGYVTELDFSNYYLVGEIIHSLLNLSHLNHLDLSSNHFNGPIPTFIGSLTRLRHLDVGRNYNLSGTIPWSIGNLTELSYLDLSKNNLSVTIPRSIGNLTELRYLDLSYNSLYGTIPPQIGKLTNLQVLSLEYAGRCGVENLEWLSPLSHLQKLGMDGISLAKQNHWVDVILSLEKLSYLSLEGCELSRVMYPYSSFLNSSSSIHTLSLGQNNMNSSTYPYISFLNSSYTINHLYLGNKSLNSSRYHWLFPLTSNKLQELDLGNNMLDGIPRYFGDLCSLTLLTFYSNSAIVKFSDFLNNLSGCTSLSLQQLFAPHSRFTGSLSDDIQKFSSLENLDLSDNQLNGTLSEKLWELTNLMTLDLSSNYLKGAISKNIGKSKVIDIDLSKNSFEGVPSIHQMSNLSYIESADFSSCKLGPRFPKWIQTLKNLSSVDISDNSISDTIPLEFWDTWPYQLDFLNLSSNNISGTVPDLSANFGENTVIDLSSNNFYGPIPNVSSNVTSLNLSKNKFSGGISFLCQVIEGSLLFLDLSHNSLTGQLPDCLWHFKGLQVLNLGHNHLFGRLPLSIGCLIKLEALDLYNNDFSGELPLSLKNCTSLNFLNLGANNFSGDVPAWIGENLSGLYVLILSSNNFFGSIPLQLCQLANLHILDLSINNLHGTIPSCLGNLTSMVQEGFLHESDSDPYWNKVVYDWYENGATHSMAGDITYVYHAMIVWQGDEREFFNNMRLLKSIVLSSNNLTGQIPLEVVNLYGLVAVNLSRNSLLGEIP